jgi:hypothetical protein
MRVERRITWGRLGPVEHAGDRDPVDEHVLDVDVTLDEHGSPAP